MPAIVFKVLFVPPTSLSIIPSLRTKIPNLGTKVRCAWEKSPKPWEQIGTGMDEKRKHLLPALFTAHADLDAFSFISAFVKDDDISAWE